MKFILKFSEKNDLPLVGQASRSKRPAAFVTIVRVRAPRRPINLLDLPAIFHLPVSRVFF